MNMIRIATTAALLGAVVASNAAMWNLTANLTGGQEVPPNNSAATGSFTGTYDDVTNVITITSFTLANYTNNITGSHLHRGAAGTNGGVIVNLPTTDWMNMGGGNWHYMGTTYTLAQAEEAGMLAGNTYLNVHSSAFPGGEIRGQVAVTPVPEPMTLISLAVGAGILARRRAKKS